MSFDLFNNRLTLRGLYVHAMAKGFLRYRNPYRRKAWKHRVEFYERAWREAAEELGATYTPLGSGFVEITLDGKTTRVNDNASQIDDALTLDVLSDKIVTYRIMEREALSVPRHAEFSLKKMGAAIEFLHQTTTENQAGGCVVKPVRGTGGGRGITAGIRTRAHLAQAAASAAVYCDDLLIEEQIKGDNYRLLYLDGELIDAFVRRPPTVIGDGRSTIARLIARANEVRLQHKAERSQVLLTVDMDVHRTLASQGLSIRSVADAGVEVVLKTVVNENCGDDNSTATHLLCDSIIADGARAARALGIRLGGVDIIAGDPSVPLSESGGVILEVNAPPNFYYHYHKKDEVFPVAVHVLRRLMNDAAFARQPSRRPTHTLVYE